MYSPPWYKQLFHTSRRTIARNWVKLYPKIKIFGITGSYGKTSTTKAIETVLNSKYSVLTTDINLDTSFNLPITLLKLRPHHQRLIFEYGIDHLGEMDQHLTLVKPDIAILTGITNVHTDSEHLGSMANLIAEKYKLIQNTKSNGGAILNWDDMHVRKISRKLTLPFISYGVAKDADIYATNIKITEAGTSMKINFKPTFWKKVRQPPFAVKTAPDMAKQTGAINATIPFIGQQFVHQAMIAVAVGITENIPLKQITIALKGVKILPGRMSIEHRKKGIVILNDSLRSNLASALAGIQSFDQMKLNIRPAHKLVVMGEMGEISHQQNTKTHQKIGEAIAKAKTIDKLIAVGPLMGQAARFAIRHGMSRDCVHLVDNPYQAGQLLKNIIKPTDFVYLKGSLLRHMERVLLILDNKQVQCRAVSCPFYHQCPNCQYLETGYPQT